MARAYAEAEEDAWLSVPRVLSLIAVRDALRSPSASAVPATHHYDGSTLDVSAKTDWEARELEALQLARREDDSIVAVSAYGPPRLLQLVSNPEDLDLALRGRPIRISKLLWDGSSDDAIPRLRPRGDFPFPVPPLFRPAGAQLRIHEEEGVLYAEFARVDGLENFLPRIIGHVIRVGHIALIAREVLRGRPMEILNNQKRDVVRLEPSRGIYGDPFKAPKKNVWQEHWAIHAFGPGLGWPVAAAVHGGRLVLAGSGPWGSRRVWLSKVGDHFNFDTGGLEGFGGRGSTLDDSAMDVVLPAGETIAALVAAAELEIYTGLGEWVLTGSPATPSSSRLRHVGSRGSRLDPHPVQPVRAEDATLFADRNGAPALLRWVGEELQHRSESLAGLAPHLARDFTRLAWLRGSRRLLGLRGDGTIACGIWRPEEDILAWSRWTAEPARRASAAQAQEEEDAAEIGERNWRRDIARPRFSDLAGDGEALFAVAAFQPWHPIQDGERRGGTRPDKERSPRAVYRPDAYPGWQRSDLLLFDEGLPTDFTEAVGQGGGDGRSSQAREYLLDCLSYDRIYNKTAFYLAPGLPMELLTDVERYLAESEDQLSPPGSRILPLARHLRRLAGVRAAKTLSPWPADRIGFLWRGVVPRRTWSRSPRLCRAGPDATGLARCACAR